MPPYKTIPLEGRDLADLKNADRETQIDAMSEWFYKNFEDPAERTPYESAEGGYIWIWGGPYDASEELQREFSGIIPDEVINELAQKLSRECWEWAPTPRRSDYDDFFIKDIALITEYHNNFSNAILDIERLLATEIDGAASHCFYRLLYVNGITALETYLSDAFINTVVQNDEFMRRFIETTPEFQTEKVSLADVFKAVEQIEHRARSYLADIVWHNIERVKPMYRDTLGIEFPKDIGAIFKAIIKRHDIVHRNGKTKSGTEILIYKQDVLDLIAAVQELTQYIDTQLGITTTPH